jgi:DNA-binding transcriptional regulator YiaG
MRSAEEKQQNDESFHHDAGDEEQPAELPTGPGTDADGVAWARAPEPWCDYLVSQDGEVVSLKRGAPHKLSLNTTHDGYDWIGLWHQGNRTFHRVNRLVWWAHKGPIPKGVEIHHRNGERRDNRLQNLEAVSTTSHRRKHTAKWDAEDVAFARWMLEHLNVSRAALSDYFGVSKTTVRRAENRQIWKGVEPKRPDEKTLQRIRNAA